VASRRWISTAVLAAAIAACSSAPAQTPASIPPAIAADVPVDPQTLVAADLGVLKHQLDAPQPTTPEPAIEQQREEAAKRLLSRPSPGTTAFLLGILQRPTGSRDAKIAIARGLANADRPDPNFVTSLLPMLGGDKAQSDAAAAALGRFGDTPVVRDRLIALAQDPKQGNLRLAYIHALGGIVSRDVANVLVKIAGDINQGALIQNAAMDSLVELTGQAASGRDLDKWKQWQAANAGKADAAWRSDIVAARAARGAELERAQSSMIAEMQQILDESYDQAPLATKYTMLMRELNSSDPRVRAMGVQRFFSEKLNTKPLPPTGPKRIKEMVGDSNAAVRIAVAQAIKAENDVTALDAILTQLPQETNLDAKIAQIQALAAMKSLRAVPGLRQLLHDPSLAAAAEAVKALKALADPLLKQNTALAHEVAEELWQMGQQRANEPGGAAFRAATIEAVGALRDKRLAKGLLGLLSLDNTEQIRSAALHGLASLGDRDTSFQISQWLSNEPSAAVRADAIAALGSTSTFELAADFLYHYMSPSTEPDPAVRDQAWRVFQSKLDTAVNIPALQRWADEFKNDPPRRLLVLLKLNEKLQRDMQWEQLAENQQNTGETYMDPKIGDPAKAAIQFELALNYWQGKQAPAVATATLVPQALKALLAARDYDKATAFAAKQIARDPAQQTEIGPDLKNAVNQLHDDGLRANDGQKLRDGVKLAEDILKMQPPLVERSQDDVRSLMQEMQDRLKRVPK
jgi:HEAT repeat protein